VTTIGTRRLYSSAKASDEGAVLRALRLGLAAAVLTGLSGCAFSLPVGSLAEDDITTSSISPRAQPAAALAAELGDEDWRRARSALAVALDPQGSGTAVSWDNPDSRKKGSFRPQGQPFVKDDEICRAFAATFVSRETSSFLEGTACRPSGGEWSLKQVRSKKA
jgi:surface antigen